MRDIDVFARLLNVRHPWKVEDVSVAPERRRLDIRLAHRRNATFICPECGRRCPTYDHLPSRTWRHLDHGDCLTLLHARIPRVACPGHGVRQVHIPWAVPGSRLTVPFERHAIDVLREADILGGCRLLRLHWHQAWNIMERAVARGRRAQRPRIIAHLGVDEKAVAKRHRYVTLVHDLDRGTVEYIGDDRKEASLAAFYQSLSVEQLAGIEAVAMDMWEPYIEATAAHVPDGRSKIVFDRYHVMLHMNDAVDRVRKSEQRRLQARGDDILKGTKYLWLFAAEDVPASRAEAFAALRARPLETGRAWELKEALRRLWDYRRGGWAARSWRRWYFRATHSRLAPVTRAARTIQGHVDNVFTYFDHRITNALSEGLNSKIQTIKKTPVVSAIGSI